MAQETNYPDPKQLRRWAEEPTPFHEFHASDLELVDDDVIRVGIGNVEYRYVPTQIMVEMAPGEWENADDFDTVDIDHSQAWDLAIDLQIEEDFICITEFTDYAGEPAQFDAYWVLGSVIVDRSGD